MVQMDIKLLDNKSGTFRVINLEDLENFVFETISLLTVDGDILFLNNEFSNSIRRNSDKNDIIGKNIKDFIGDVGNQVIEIYKQVSKSNMPVTREFNFPYGKDERWHNSKLIPVYVGEKNIPAILTIFLGTSDNDSAKLALRKSEQNYKILIDSLVDSLLIVFKGKIIFANESLYGVSGYNENEIMGNSFLMFFDDDEGPKILEYYNKRIKGKNVPSKYRAKAISKDGNYHDIEIIPNNVFFEGKEAIQVIIRDITDHVAMQKELENTNRYLETLMSNLPGFVYRCFIDKDWTMVFMSNGCKDLLGYNPQDIVLNKKIKYADIIFQDDRVNVQDSIYKNLNTNDTFELEYRIINKVGDIKWVWEKGRKVEIEGQEFLEGFVTDITSRKFTQQQLLNSETKFKAIFEGINDAVFVHPYKNKGYSTFIEVNNIAVSRYGYSREELLSMSPLDIHDPNSIDNLYKEKNKSELFQTKQRLFDGMNITKSGKIFPVEISSRLFELDGKPMIMSMVRDITKRKEDEKKLVDSETRLKILADATFEAICLSEDGKCLDQNLTAEKMFGYRLDEAFGRGLTDWIHPDDREFVRQKLKQKVVKPYEVRALRKDGTVFPCQIQARMAIINGKNIRMSALRDITDMKQAEQELLKSEERFRKYIQNTPFGIFITNSHGFFTEVNKAGEDLTGYSRNELIKLRFAELLQPEDIETFASHFEALQKKGKIISDELKYKRKDGEIRTWHIDAVKIDDNQFLGTTYDITQQREDENRILQLIHDQQVMLDNDPSFIMFKDTNDKILRITNTVATITGLRKSQIEGKPSSVIYPKMYKEYYKDDLEVIKTGKPKTGIIEPLYSHDGKTTWLLTNKIPYIEKGNKVKGIIVFSTDITPLKDFEDELVRKNRELKAEKEKAEESDRLKSAFLANMSHEIRTPMNGILGFTNLLRSPDLSGDKMDEYIEIIQQSGDRMLSTINDLIDISKIESGIEVVNLSEINLVETTEKLYKFFLPDANRKGLKLKFRNMLNNDSFIVLTDPDKMDSILTNLIKNAIKFTFSGFVEIKIDFADNNAVISVSDSGIGIPLERQQAVFDRFVQADIADSKVFEGSGLGLSITAAYVDMLGGSINLNSKEGEGTEFIVSFPLGSEKLLENYNNAKKMETDSNRSKSAINILIAEDDEISFELLKIALGSEFGKIYHAENGKEAINIFKNNDDIGLIIMDVKMPIMDGLEATSEIRKLDKDIKIIAQTAYALAGDETKVLDSGCNDYISKPIDIDELRKKIYENL